MNDTPHYIIGSCANCDSPAVTVKTPLFCSPRCRQAAELVRYVRACHRDGRDWRDDVKEATQMKLAMVLGGGYPERERAVPQEVRAEVFRRANDRCEECGRPFDAVLLSELPAGVDPCGEHGEFHTFVWDAPGFRSPIDVEIGEIVERDGFVFCDVCEPG